MADAHCELIGLIQRAPYIRTEDVTRQYTVNWLMNNGVTVRKRGRWIKDYNGVVICSECGAEHEWEDYRASFCEDCGSEMNLPESQKEELLCGISAFDEATPLTDAQMQKMLRRTKNTKPGCPKCGCDSFYANVYGRQYYTAEGEPAGYEIDGETKTLFCYKCRYKTTLERLVKKNETA